MGAPPASARADHGQVIEAAGPPMTRRAAMARQQVSPPTSVAVVSRPSRGGATTPRRRGWIPWVAVSSALLACAVAVLHNVGGTDAVVTLLTAQAPRSGGGPARVESSPVPSPAGVRAASSAQSSGASPPAGAATPASSGTPGATSGAGPVAGGAGMRMYGTPRSGLAWQSGWWQGGQMNAAATDEAGRWRGRPMDVATTYPEYDTWSDLAASAASVTTFKGFPGRLSYGLPLLPNDRKGQWGDITSGAKDDVFRTIARQLRDNGFGDSAVRVGLEANGAWYAHAVTAQTAAQYKAAFRRVVAAMRAEAPELTFWYDLSVSTQPLPGTSGRADVLDLLYPGDDVVDGISMDHYDFYSLVARTDRDFDRAVRPPNGVGLADAADFARAHRIGLAVPEWGVHAVQGIGDNPFFMRKVFGFFTANRDVLVYEAYFDESDPYIGSALKNGQNPRSAAVYRELWGRR